MGIKSKLSSPKGVLFKSKPISDLCVTAKAASHMPFFIAVNSPRGDSANELRKTLATLLPYLSLICRPALSRLAISRVKA